jgi:molybdopterin-guanine dinucleotide biosynthesis protein A
MISKEGNSSTNIAPPPLFGLVLAGGKSTRMGQDKGAIRWHGEEQRLHMAQLLSQFCRQVYISCRQEQAEQMTGSYPLITDTHQDLGPFGAILSAFETNPSVAWLVTACDLPLLDASTLGELIQQRAPTAMATTFKSPHDGLPEPLITIWEPDSYPILTAAVPKGYRCPRKVLINNAVKIITPTNPIALMNVNTPQESAQAHQLLHTYQMPPYVK